MTEFRPGDRVQYVKNVGAFIGQLATVASMEEVNKERGSAFTDRNAVWIRFDNEILGQRYYTIGADTDLVHWLDVDLSTPPAVEEFLND